jgi:hypothetical protein
MSWLGLESDPAPKHLHALLHAQQTEAFTLSSALPCRNYVEADAVIANDQSYFVLVLV